MHYEYVTPFDKFPHNGEVLLSCKVCHNDFCEEKDEFQSDICESCNESFLSQSSMAN